MIKTTIGLFFCLLFSFCGRNTEKPTNYNIVDFGALTDSTKKSTKAIQAAIDECTKNGGGTVYIPTGTFISGTLNLKSNVTLFLENGAVLKGSSDTADYFVQKDGTRMGLLYTRNQKNITINGDGIIDGNGTVFFDATQPHNPSDLEKSFTRQGEDFMNIKYGLEDGPIKYKFRPGMMMVFMKCENIKILNVTLKDTPEWTMRVGDCDDVLIKGVSIKTNILVPNSDGVHFTNSRNIRIADCDFRCGDDAIIVTGFDERIDVHGKLMEMDANPQLYGNKTGISENIVVSNCVLMSRSAAIRIGYGEHTIRNAVFSNIVIYDSNRGIGIFARDTASIENIEFNNIQINTRLHKGHWWGKGEPIHVSAIRQKENVPVGVIKNIRFSNITASAETGILLLSDETDKIQNLKFDNLDLTIRKSPIDDIYGGNIDLRPAYKKDKQLYKSDLAAIQALGITNLKLENVEVKWEANMADYFTNALYCEKVKGGYVRYFSGEGASSKFKGIQVENSTLAIMK